MRKTKVDEKIMAELLEQPGVKENVAQMTAAELAMFRDLLVRGGIYARYCKERKHGPRV